MCERGVVAAAAGSGLGECPIPAIPRPSRATAWVMETARLVAASQGVLRLRFGESMRMGTAMQRDRDARRGREYPHAALIIAAFVLSGSAHATDGDIDPSFGSGGVALGGSTGAPSDSATKPIVQADGKILYCSQLQSDGGTGLDFFIARFDRDGTLDTTFDFDGRLTIDFDGGADACHALAVQADGKIVAIGWTHGQSAGASDDFAVARVNADGSLDTTFGAGTGKATIAFDLGGDNTDQANAIALQPDGKMVIAGEALVGGLDYDFAVVRLLQDGTRDTTFNLSGRVTIPFDLPAATNKIDVAYAVVLDRAGRIVVGGSAQASSNGGDFAVARLLSNGALDDNFNADGRATLAFDVGWTFDDGSRQTIVDRDGRIVMVGYADASTGTSPSYDIAVARLLPDGSPDAGFGYGGRALVAYDLGGINTDFGYGVIEDPEGRLVVAGTSISDTSEVATITRLRADGQLDADFGVFGKAILDFGSDYGSAYGVALQGTQLIVAGERASSDLEDFVVRLAVDLIFADGLE